MSEKIIGAMQLIRLLGIPARRLDYLERGLGYPAPKKNFAGHRIYTEADVKKIAEIDKKLKMKKSKT